MQSRYDLFEISIYIHSYMFLNLSVYMHLLHKPSYKCTYSNVHMHIYIHAYTHTNLCACMCVWKYVFISQLHVRLHFFFEYTFHLRSKIPDTINRELPFRPNKWFHLTDGWRHVYKAIENSIDLFKISSEWDGMVVIHRVSVVTWRVAAGRVQWFSKGTF